jgi:hypothetical protein
LSMSIQSCTLNSSNNEYTAGQTIEVTIDYTSTDYTNGPSTTADYNFVGQVSDSVGSSAVSAENTFIVTTPGSPVADPTSATVSDTGNRTWTLQSNVMNSINAEGVSTWTAVVTATA